MAAIFTQTLKTAFISITCLLIISCSCSNTAGVKGNGDLTAPEVSAINPTKFKTKVPLNSFISVNFSEVMDINSISSDSFYLKDENNKRINAEVFAQGKVASLKPIDTLDFFTRYTVTLERKITDLNGNRLVQDFQWLFTTGNEYDTTPPEIEGVIPSENEIEVSINTQVTVSFSEYIDYSSVTASSFRVEDSSGRLVGGSLEINATQVKFTPDNPLEYSTQYLLTVSSDVQDVSGNKLQSNFISYFTTGVAPDTTQPYVVNVYPKHNDMLIPKNSSISVTFNETLGDTALESGNFVLSHSNNQIVSGIVTVRDNILLFTPNTELLPTTQYSAVLKQTINDLSGNQMAEDFNWQFTTGDDSDTTPPSITNVQPEIDAAEVANNNSITVTFSEPIDPKTLGFTKFTVIANGDYVAGRVTYSGTTAIFKPKNALANSTLHEVSIASGVSDLAGNLTSDAFTWTFTTGNARDNDLPRVSSVFPEHSAMDFSVNSAVIVRFTEATNPSTVTPKSFYIQDSNGNTIESTVVTIGASSSLRPLTKLNFSEQYTAFITTEVTDLADNAMQEIYSWSFTTATEEDTISPSISSTTPSSGSQNAAVNRGIIVSFSEAMDAESININSFFITDTSGNIIPGILEITEDTAIHKPLSNLEYTKTYVATVLNSIKDIAGNPLNKVYSWNFTTGSQPDMQPPTIVSTTPIENGLAAVNHRISIQFSEAMSTSSLNTTTIKLTDLNGNLIETVVNAAEKNAYIRPINALYFDTNYRLTVTTGVKDLANNKLAGNFVLNFKTGLHPDLAPPFIVSVTPYDQQQDVQITTQPTILFSEAIDCLSLTADQLKVLSNGVAVNGAVSCNNDTLVFEPDQVLETQSDFILQVATGISDLSGDYLENTYQSTFTTASWTRQTGTVFSEQAFSITSDNEDNLITAGFTIGNFGSMNQGSSDIFVNKFDKNSLLLWTRQFGSSDDDFVTASITDAANNIYLTGYTYGELAGTGNGNSDIFIIKLDASGNILWQQQLGSAEDDAANGIAIDGDGNVLIIAYSFADFDSHSSSGQHDVVVIKLDNDGNKIWSQQYGSVENDIPNAIRTDSENNIVITGYSLGDLQANVNQGEADIFISKLSSDGVHQWTSSIGSPFTDIAQAISIDSLDQVVITGYTLGELNGETNAGSADHFVAKVDDTGTLVWLKQFGTILDDRAYAIAHHSDDTLAISGYTAGDMEGINTGKFDMVAYQLDVDGTLLWTNQIGSSQDDVAFGLTVDSTGNTYLSGYTAGSLDNIDNLGQHDMFIVKLDANGEKK